MFRPLPERRSAAQSLCDRVSSNKALGAENLSPADATKANHITQPGILTMNRLSRPGVARLNEAASSVCSAEEAVLDVNGGFRLRNVT